MHQKCMYYICIMNNKIILKNEANPSSIGLREVKNGILLSDTGIHCKYTCYITTQKLISII